MMWLLRLVATVVALSPMTAAAQQSPPPSEWATRMQLERQFAGPLQDTIVQRWRDPVDGMICYIYLPITAAHTPPTPSGYVQYGANSIGSISCVPGAAGHAASKTSASRVRAAPAEN
jgi:hypothetical protein